MLNDLKEKKEDSSSKHIIGQAAQGYQPGL